VCVWCGVVCVCVVSCGVRVCSVVWCGVNSSRSCFLGTEDGVLTPKHVGLI